MKLPKEGELFRAVAVRLRSRVGESNLVEVIKVWDDGELGGVIYRPADALDDKENRGMSIGEFMRWYQRVNQET